MSKSKATQAQQTTESTESTEFVPPSAASQDPPAPAAIELYERIEKTVFGLCDLLGWPKDLELFAAKIAQHPAVQDFVPHSDDPFLTLQAAGELVGRSGQTIRNWIAEGYVESEIDPSGLRRVRKSKLLRFFRGTALGEPFSAETMTVEQQGQYDVTTQLQYATIFCRYCNKQVIENTDRPRDWLQIHSQTCNAETFADSNRPH
jgi:hypothetical protein